VKLATADRRRAEAFLLEQARPLERALFRFYFRGGPASAVLSELAQFQNHDGGFGQALEPDFRLAASSALATSVALQIMRELPLDAHSPLVQGAMSYLLATYDPDLEAWPIIPPHDNTEPHAPWWLYDRDLARRWGGFKANPTAELVGYFYDYAGLVPAELRRHLSQATEEHLERSADTLEMHDILCFVRLAESDSLPEALRARLVDRLVPAIDRAVARDPAEWMGYGLQPLAVAGSPRSPFLALLGESVAANLDFLIGQQEMDGTWTPNWSWGDQFPDVWPQARQDWTGVLTLRALRQLQAFDRLDQPGTDQSAGFAQEEN